MKIMMKSVLGILILLISTLSLNGVYYKLSHVNLPSYDLERQGDYVFVAANEQGLVVLDVSNPQSPVQVRSITVQCPVPQFAINSNRAYFTCGTQGIAIVDISNSLIPVQNGQYIIANQTIYVEDLNNIANIYKFKSSRC